MSRLASRGRLAASATVITAALTGILALGNPRHRIVPFLLLYALAFFAYWWGIRVTVHLSRRALGVALAVACVWRLALVLAPPLLSDDIYRYVWEGRIQHLGANPYALPPDAPALAPYRDAIWEGINHKDYAAIYPPLSQLFFRGVTAVTDSVRGMKGAIVLLDLATIGALLALLRRRGDPAANVLVYAWSPLVLVEVAGSGHLDPLAILLTVIALVLLSMRRTAPAAAALAGAAMSKLLPGLFLLAWGRRWRPRHVALFLLLVLLLVAPFASAGEGLIRSLLAFSRKWQFNESAFALLSLTAGGHEAGVRLMGALLLGLAALLAWRRVDPTNGAFAIVAATLALSPNVLPWYALWLVPFLCLRREPAALLFTGTVALAYLVYPVYLAGHPWKIGWGVRALEYLPVALAALWGPAGLRLRALRLSKRGQAPSSAVPPSPEPRSAPPPREAHPARISLARRDVLLVFLKCPRPGAVKTRLIPALGPERAALLYRAIAEVEVRGTAPRGAEYDRLLLYSGTENQEEMEEWFPAERWLPQEGRDLGERMAAAFEEAFRRGARRVAIIGSDVPWLSREGILEAFGALRQNDLVIGPCADGGYYLLALSGPRPELFQGVRWGTSSVLSDTLDRARGLRIHLLPPLQDLDTLDDLTATWPRLRPLLPPGLANHLEQALRRVLGG